ncbi:MAG: MBL fold metallo-hydrolase [Planctomycetota bacterium]
MKAGQEMDLVVRGVAVGPLETNAWIVGSRRSGDGVVIDPGADVDLIRAAARKVGISPRRILITHGHFDHVGAAAALSRATGAPVYLHREDSFWIERLVEQTEAFGFPAPEKPVVGGYLAEGEEVSAGGIPLKILHVPGHSPGHVAFVTEGHVFAGDCLFAGSVGRTDLPGGSAEILISSIRKKLLVLPETTAVHPGHGPDTTIGREKRDNPFL